MRLKYKRPLNACVVIMKNNEPHVYTLPVLHMALNDCLNEVLEALVKHVLKS